MILRFLFLASLVSCATTSGAPDTYLAYWSKPEVGSLNVAFVVSELRGKALKDGLLSRLRTMCSELPILPRYRISVYSEARFVESAKRSIGKIPNLNDPEFRELESNRLASYAPENGVISFYSNSSVDQVPVGTQWCKGA